MTDYHDHSIKPSAPKTAPDDVLSLLKKANASLDTIAENTAPAEDSEA